MSTQPASADESSPSDLRRTPLTFALRLLSYMRFTIRDMLWLTAIVGLGIAWSSDHQRLTGKRWPMWRQNQQVINSKRRPLGGPPHDLQVLTAGFDASKWLEVFEEYKQGRIWISIEKTKEYDRTSPQGKVSRVREYHCLIHLNKSNSTHNVYMSMSSN